MKVLYFTDDFSEANVAFAKDNGLTLRDVRAYRDDDFLEKCDAVCGDVPQAYKDKYPVHELVAKTEPEANPTPKPRSRAKA